MSAGDPTSVPGTDDVSPAAIVPRGLVGGLLMGLANLVPGISGGTMLLAAGIYPRFIESVAKATALRLDRGVLFTLGSVGVSAAAAIVLFAGPVKDLVVGYRWIMYALFIGLTLGGVPIVRALLREAGDPSSRPARIGMVVGFLAMAALAWVQMRGGGGGTSEGMVIFFLGGLGGASAMILPGISGGYLLLVLGAYVPILAGIDAFRAALSAGDVGALVSVGTSVILPVGLGVLVGIAGVAHALRWCLERHSLVTLGALLGLLVGAVVGLWPFQEAALPAPGDLVKGQEVEVVRGLSEATEGFLRLPGAPEGVVVRFVGSGEPVDAEDLPVRFFRPTAGQAAGALGLVLLGIGLTTAVGHLGRER